MQLTVKQVEEIDRKLQSAKSQVQSAKSQVQRAREEATKALEGVVNVLEVNGTAFIAGALNGRFQNPQVVGVPVDLGVGVVLQLASFFDVAPQHLRAIGNGFTATYFAGLGTGIGTRMLAESASALPVPAE